MVEKHNPTASLGLVHFKSKKGLSHIFAVRLKFHLLCLGCQLSTEGYHDQIVSKRVLKPLYFFVYL